MIVFVFSTYVIDLQVTIPLFCIIDRKHFKNIINSKCNFTTFAVVIYF